VPVLFVLVALLVFAPRIAGAQPSRAAVPVRQASRADSIDAQLDVISAMRFFEMRFAQYMSVPSGGAPSRGRTSAMDALLAERPSVTEGLNGTENESGSRTNGVVSPFGTEVIAPTFGAVLYCEQVIGDFCMSRRSGGGMGIAPNLAVDMSRYSARHVRRNLVGTIAKFREPVDAALAKAAAVVPGDHWIAGMRVWFPLEFDQIASAERAARDCRADRWWCEMLLMYVLTRRNDIASADSILDRSLADMPARTRCVWSDVSRLLRDGAARNAYLRMNCAERAAVEERVWWLADPFFGAPGNERRVEHFMRETHVALMAEFTSIHNSGLRFDLQRMQRATADVMATTDADSVGAEGPVVPLEERAQTTYLSLVPDSLFRVNVRTRWTPPVLGATELFIRGGLPTGYLSQGDYFYAQYHPTPHYQFVPAQHALTSPFQSRDDDWELAPRIPWEWMESRYGPFLALEFQMARFRRGDSTRLAAVTDVTADDRFLFAPIAGVLAFSTGPRVPPVLHRIDNMHRYAFSPVVPTDSAVVGLEIEAQDKAVGWARFGFVPLENTTQPLHLSDIALYDTRDSARAAPASLDDMLPRMLATVRLPEGSKVGAFWEVYGLSAGDQATFTISAQRLDRDNIAHRLIDRLFGTTANPVPIRISWEDPMALGRAIEPRSLSLDLAALEPGRYRLLFTAALPGQPAASTQRDIEILKRW
jgi:hypothetical protein